MTTAEYEALGINPNSRDHGYECRHCGYVPTQKELDDGTRCCRQPEK
jgi:hypothetical protein